MIESYHFFQQLKDFPFVEKIFLYGSRSRGDNSLRADIDLAIFCPEASNLEWQQILEVVESADTLLEIDCVRLDTVQNERFKNAILKDAKTLYERGKNG